MKKLSLIALLACALSLTLIGCQPIAEPAQEGSSEHIQTTTAVGEEPESSVQGYWELGNVTYKVISKFGSEWSFLWQVGIKSWSPGQFLAKVHVEFLDSEGSVLRHAYAVKSIKPYDYVLVTEVTEIRYPSPSRVASIRVEVDMTYYPSGNEIVEN